MEHTESSVAVVTGGGSGMGRATAITLGARGWSVGVLDRDAANADVVAAHITGAGGRAIALACDVADDTAVGDAVATTAREFGRITGLVTSAGIFHPPDLSPIESIGIDDFMHVLAVNLNGTFSAIRHCLPHMKQGGGSIVTIASTAALRGHGFGAGYTASKGGVDALTRLVAVQAGPQGVRANCICPGGIDTPMTAGAFAGEEAERRAAKAVPLARWGVPDDVGNVAAFLLSPEAAYVTGQTIAVEGGATAV